MVAHVAAAGFLSHYLNGPLPYVRRHITVNKNVLSASLNNTFPSFPSSGCLEVRLENVLFFSNKLTCRFIMYKYVVIIFDHTSNTITGFNFRYFNT